MTMTHVSNETKVLNIWLKNWVHGMWLQQGNAFEIFYRHFKTCNACRACRFDQWRGAQV